MTKGTFEDVVRAHGTLQPLSTVSIKAKVHGTILKLAQDGARVEKGDLLIEIDPVPYQEALATQEAQIARLKAEHVKDQENGAKNLRQAKDDVDAHAQRVELERLRLKTLEDGPTEQDLLNAQVALDNAKALYDSLKEELEIMTALSDEARYSQGMLEQKRLTLNEQASKVGGEAFALLKLKTQDPIALADQRQKLGDEQHQLDAARSNADRIEKNLKKAEAAFAQNLKQAEAQRDLSKSNIAKSKVLAPAPGYALIGSRNGVKYGPGLSVGSREVMTFSDLRKMKAEILVDEGRVGCLHAGQAAVVRPVVDRQAVLCGKVVSVAEHGHDEFDELREETQDIVGRANRQVFTVEVELEESVTPLRPGQKVDVAIVVCRLDSALLVPRAAVFTGAGGERFVWRDTALGVEQAAVKVAAENELTCAVDGVNEGDWVRLTAP
ncbi:MAG: biotin/lipoyl-binding protein [Planctomycetes bacterium]|nr:biotin/lipoyl-binding protein [Planctomycetota bacterium]